MKTPRENLLSLYRRQGYDYAPVGFNMCPSLREHYRQIAGDTPLSEYFDYPEGFACAGVGAPPLRKREPIDWARYYPDGVKDGIRYSPFGVGHEPGSAAAKHMTRMRHPMQRFDSLEQMQAYPFPELDVDDLSPMRARAEAIHAEGRVAVGGMQTTIWEKSWYMRGMAELMLDMTIDDEKAVYLLDRITDFSAGQARAYAQAGADIIELGDDIGTQTSIMMSLEMYREWLKPRLKRVIDAARAVKPDILVFYHSCGFVTPYIDDLIEAGVDILNPVQPECMDFGEIHAQYGERLSFNGTVGTQTTMPFATPDEVRALVHANLTLAGERGGLLCCPTHLLEPEVPWANIEAYVAACKEFTRAGA